MYNPFVEKIIGTIRSSPQSALPFDEYMEMCLYDAEGGYYQTDRVRIGKEGDFYTSSNLGSVMGEMIAAYAANELVPSFPAERPVFLVEWGSGTGRLASHILDELHDRFPQVYERILYVSIESSATHRLVQQETLDRHRNKVLWRDEEEWLSGRDKFGEAPEIVLSNELLDAMPVKRAKFRGGRWLESFVRWDEAAGQFHGMWLEPTAELDAYLSSRLGHIRWFDEQEIEVNLRARTWLKRVGERLSPGSFILTIDYGDLEEELYAEHRLKGTFMCYHRHRAHDDPFVFPGEQDMTSHVNFSELIRTGQEAGLTKRRWMTQKQFLVEAGILGKLEAHTEVDPFHPTVRKNRFIRQLLLSDQMSELFKVLIQCKQ